MAIAGSGCFYGMKDQLPANALALMSFVNTDTFNQAPRPAYVRHIGDDRKLKKAGWLAIAFNDNKFLGWIC